MDGFEVMRALEEWQRAGAYSVRIQGMNRQHHISLRDEFDEHDGDESKYIVLLDDTYPIATCRFFELGAEEVLLGRVVVLPEYRGKRIGAKLLSEAEKWIAELGYKRIIVDSRLEAVGFYEASGFCRLNNRIIKSWSFECIRMVKTLSDN